MSISLKEIEAMSNRSTKDRYVYFIKKSVDNETIWVLDDNGYAMSGDGSGNDVIMLWPSKEYAERCATNDWANYKPLSLDLDYVIDELLPSLSGKKIKLGIFMVPSSSTTSVIDADSLLVDLDSECQKYN